MKEYLDDQGLYNGASFSPEEEAPLAISVTEDCDDVYPRPPLCESSPSLLENKVRSQQSPHLIGNNNNNNKEKRNDSKEALTYLLRYETMVRQQEAEDMATLEHMGPCLKRLEEIIQGTRNSKSSLVTTKKDKEDIWQHTFSFRDLGYALDYLNRQGPQDEFLVTDRQLMMVLQVLMEQMERNNSSSQSSPLTSKTSLFPGFCEITWAELVHCYKTCIVGMQTLQHLPSPSLARDRTRHRTLAMISLFDRDSTESFSIHATKDEEGKVSSREMALHSTRPVSRPSRNTSIEQLWGQESFGKRILILSLVASCCFGVWLQPFLSWVDSTEVFSANIPNAPPQPNDSFRAAPDLLSKGSRKIAYAHVVKQAHTGAQRTTPRFSFQPKSELGAARGPTTRTTTHASSKVEHDGPMLQPELATRSPSEKGSKTKVLAQAILAVPATALILQALQASFPAMFSMGPVVVVFGAGIASLASAAVQAVRSLIKRFQHNDYPQTVA